MNAYHGKSAYNGFAIGPIHVINDQTKEITFECIKNSSLEIKRLDEAVINSQKQLEKLYNKAVIEVGKADAEIFSIHQMMLEDEDFIDAIHEFIETKLFNAEYAVSQTGKEFALMFEQMDDEYMKARSTDVIDISQRLVNTLLGFTENSIELNQPSIVVADDLTPSITMEFDKSKVLAFVMKKGSLNSHTAILARMMSIPALVSTDICDLTKLNNKLAIVDGNKGCFYVDPDQEKINEANEQISLQKEIRKIALQYKGKESKTIDGKKINIFGNIGSVDDVESVLENDGEGIGLFRSEFLYLGRNSYPTEEEQFVAYKTVLKKMGDKSVIVRTLDIGADKKVDYFNLDKEENPAMGYRAIRICLDRPKLFKTQLRALLRASVYGNLSIMYPMIISLNELKQINIIVNEVAQELDKQSIEYRIPKQGIMIETPAAVLISDLLAKEVDFFSIGTNDLTQYILAIDRQNSKLDNLCDTHHEAILRAIELVCRNAEKENVWVGICGELGADKSLTERFIKMGVKELSVAPPFILPVRKSVCESTSK
jgi:phosphotransferase system enzyme I (PtsI)